MPISTFFSIIPIGLIMADNPLFADLITYFPLSIDLKILCAHSIFRSIESGKYVIRSANNGLSAIINPIGIIEKKVEIGTTGYIDFKESKILKSTLYMNYGDKIFFILILLYIFLIFSFKKITHE